MKTKFSLDERDERVQVSHRPFNLLERIRRKANWIDGTAAADKIERKINKLVSGGGRRTTDGKRKSDKEIFNGGNCMDGDEATQPNSIDLDIRHKKAYAIQFRFAK